MRTRSIGVRLALWYATVLAVALAAFGAAVWFALNHSLYHAVDESLRDRIEGVRLFIEAQTGWLSLAEMQEEFREHSVLGPGGDLFQVADRDGNWLYRSDPLYDEHVPIYRARELGEQRFENVLVQGARLRFLSQNVAAGGMLYTVQVAAPLDELERGLQEFLWALVPALPLILLAASAGGSWISRRALRPVDQITQAARSLSAENLSLRLAVPQTGDELERLSQTLNDMIARLDAAFKRTLRFTADASHELRTPLAVMRTTAEVALRDTSDSGEHREALEQIVAEVERMSQLVDNLLLIARADSGEARLNRTRVDLVEAARDAGAQAGVLAKAKGVTLGVELPADPVWIEGDREAVRRLLLLLIDNAVKYTPTGGRIEVSVALGPDGVAIACVKDTGIGIPPADLPHIFERFYRVDAARSRDYGGAGLGLAIGRWIAQAHGGTLTAESALGQGSAFTVRLPALFT